VLEAKARASSGVATAPKCESRLQQRPCANEVCLDERTGAVDRPIHVAFRRKVENGVWLYLAEYGVDRRTVADIDIVVLMALAQGCLCQGF